MDKRRIREKWTDNCRGLWDDWVLFTQHERNDNGSDEYVELSYDRMPVFLLVLLCAWVLLNISFYNGLYFWYVLGDFEGSIQGVFSGVTVGFASIMGMLYITNKKDNLGKSVLIGIILFITIFLSSIFWGGIYVFFMSTFLEGLYFSVSDFIKRVPMFYWCVRVLVSTVFMIINHFCYMRLKEIRDDIYTKGESKAYWLSQIHIWGVPLFLLIVYVINSLVSFNFIVSSIILLLGYILNLIVFAVGIFKLKLYKRISKFATVTLYWWTLWSLIELFAVMDIYTVL